MRAIICDSCGKAEHYDKAHQISLEVTPVHTTFVTLSRADKTKDLCDECYQKIATLFPPEKEHEESCNCE